MIENYYEIDKQGNIIGRFKINSITDIPRPWWVKGNIDDMYEPRYINGEWIDVKSDSELLEDLKKAKSDELNRECQKRILEGFDESIRSIKYHFSYDAEAQINFQETYLLFINGVIEEVNWTVMNTSGEKVRIILEREDFQKVYFESINHKLRTISHYRDTLVPMIKTTRTKEELEQIDWEMTPAGDHLVISPEKALDKKVGTISGEVIAQKQVNIMT